MKTKVFLKKFFKTVIYWAFIGFFIWLLYKNAGDYSKILETIQDANYVFLAWGILLAVGNLSVMTVIFKTNFKIFEKDIEMGTLLPEMISFSFLAISNPLGFSGATALMIKRLVARGHSYLKSIFAFFSTQLSVNIAFFPILGLTLWYLNERNQLSSYEIFASQFLLIFNIAIIVCATLILVLPNFSRNVAVVLANVANRIARLIFRRSVVNTKNLSNNIEEIQKASGKFDHSVSVFSKTLLYSLLYHVINVAVLYLAFQAYGVPPRIEIITTIYGIIVLFSVVSPTPQGIGLVEGLAQLGAVSIGVESETALVAILTYRLMTIWLPALLGFLVFRSFKKQP